jgi:transitional endoplasmic reticulum ATPase
MDKETLTILESALAAAPANAELQQAVLKACLQLEESARAQQLIERYGISAADWAEPSRRVVAELHLLAGQAERALVLLQGQDPHILLLRVKALLALGRREPALEAYRQAVGANPALEDAQLAAELSRKVVPFKAVSSVEKSVDKAVRTEANDNTDESEIIRVMFPQTERVTFKDVGGLHEVKKQIHRKIIIPFQKPSLFQRFKKKAGGGILLYGPPGCGKTMLARATAGECGAAFYNIAISDVLDMYIGESERKLHAIFDQARRTAPAVLFFDEVEALGGKRQYTREATSSKLVSQFLSELDGFAQNNQGVLILAATNVPWAVDSAFRRPGRFDRVLFVPPPDQDARLAIVQSLVTDRPVQGKLEFALLARQTSGFSGADLRNLVETAIDEAIEESIGAEREVPLHMRHLEQALKQVKSTTVEWLTTARNYARYSNESGQYDEVLEFLRKHGKE